MGGIELRDDELVVGRDPNDLDDLAIRFSAVLGELDIDHVYVLGYVVVLAGRSRATEDIDVLLERLEAEQVDELATRLRDEGFWGPAMPLDSMDEMLADDGHVWVARDGEMVPRLEVKFVRDEVDRASLENSLTATIGSDGVELPVGPLELQIAYKLFLGSRTDFEDAVHLYALFEETLSTDDLRRWVETLGVEEEYDRLTHV
ncbi:MAG: hypothetical protein ABEH77_08170 [Halobacteriaceae archaeon]